MLQQTAAAMLVSGSSQSHRAAAAAELWRSLEIQAFNHTINSAPPSGRLRHAIRPP